jgi:hypothetical protein
MLVAGRTAAWRRSAAARRCLLAPWTRCALAARCRLQRHTQHRSAWTHEIDLRPYKEPF